MHDKQYPMAYVNQIKPNQTKIYLKADQKPM